MSREQLVEEVAPSREAARTSPTRQGPMPEAPSLLFAMLDVLGNQETARLAPLLRRGVVSAAGFDPTDRVRRLVGAIEQVEGQTRHVDFDAVVHALHGLSASELTAVEAAYLDAQERPLRYDLFQGGASGCPTDLTFDQVKRLEDLLSIIPADVGIGFNPMDRMHRLVEAINQTELYEKGRDERGIIFLRRVNFTAVFNALNGLSAGEVKLVEEAYRGYEERELRFDLFRGGDSGFPTDLTVDQVERLEALLGGTRATSAEDAEAAAENWRRVEAAELWSIFWGKRTDPGTERVMEILRRSAEANAALVETYDRRHVTTFLAGLYRLPPHQIVRALALLRGSSVEADAMKIRWLRNRIAELDQLIAGTDSVTIVRFIAAAGTMGASEHRNRFVIEAAKAERKKLVGEIVSRLQLASDEARDLAESTKAAEEVAKPSGVEWELPVRIQTAGDIGVQTRVAALAGGDVHGLAQLIGGHDEAIVRAIATADPGAKAAAELVKMRQEDTLSADKLTAMFRGLRDQAAMDAGRRHPMGTADEIEAEERILAEEYFDRLKTTWNLRFPAGPTFETLLEKGGGKGAELNKALATGQGRLGDVAELVFALSGGRKDMETVKRVLRNKSPEEIKALEAGYRAAVQRELRFDLFGEAPTTSGETNPFLLGPGGPAYLKDQGKASGADRLLLEDYMQRVEREGGPEEVVYLWGRAEREYKYTIDNRGMVGAWRDWWGNEALSLLNSTIGEVRTSAAKYLALVGWDFRARTAKHPEDAESAEAHELLQTIRLARATIRGDRVGYEKATAALREKFRAVASFVLQAVLTAVLTPAAAALFAARSLTLGLQVVRWAANATVSVASTVGANAVVYGRDYSWSQFKRDVSGGYMGAIGGTALEKVVGGATKGLAARLGGTTPPEILKMANTLGGMELQAVAEGKSLTEDLSFQNFVEQHLMGKAAETVTAGATKVMGLEPTPPPGPRPEEGRPPAGEEPRVRAAGGEPGAGTPTGGRAGEEPGAAPRGGEDVEAPARVPMALEPESGGSKARRAAGGEPGAGTPTGRPAGEEPGAAPRGDEDVPTRAPMALEPQGGDVKARRAAAAEKALRDAEGSDQPPEITQTDLRPLEAEEPTVSRDRLGIEPDSPLDTWRGRLNRAKQRDRAAETPGDALAIQRAATPDARARRQAERFAPLYAEWRGRQPAERRARIETLINEYLAREGVHPITVELAALEPGNARFGFQEWSIRLSQEAIEVGRITPEDFAILVDNAVHEARHAVQHFRGIRAGLHRGDFNYDAPIRAEIIIAAKEANARRRPDREMSEEAYGEALEIYEVTHEHERRRQELGEDALDREAVLDRKDEAKAIRDVLRQERDRTPEGTPEREAADRALQNAELIYQEAHNAYTALPQESEAWRYGSAVRVAVREHLALRSRLDEARVLRDFQRDERNNTLEGTPERQDAERALREADLEYVAAQDAYLALLQRAEGAPPPGGWRTPGSQRPEPPDRPRARPPLTSTREGASGPREMTIPGLPPPMPRAAGRSGPARPGGPEGGGPSGPGPGETIPGFPPPMPGQPRRPGAPRRGGPGGGSSGGGGSGGGGGGGGPRHSAVGGRGERPFPADLDVAGAVDRSLSEVDADRRPYVGEEGQLPAERPHLGEHEAAATGSVSPAQRERMNAAIAGQVALNLPHPAQVQRARERLANGRPTLQDVTILIRQAVGEARAFFVGENGGLAAEHLAGRCPLGRDLTTFSLSTLVEGSSVPVRVRRYSLDGLAGRTSGEAHQFGVVEFDLPSGTQRFILDPTFSQFALYARSDVHPHVVRTPVSFNQARGSAGGAETMARLMSDGFVPLTDATARLYVDALVPPGYERIDPGRLLRGEGGVGGGQEDLSRTSHLTLGPGADPLPEQMRRIHYVEPEVSDLVASAQALRAEGRHDLAHAVDELRARLDPYDIDNLRYEPTSAYEVSEAPLAPLRPEMREASSAPRVPVARYRPPSVEEQDVPPQARPLGIRARIDDVQEAERMYREQRQQAVDGLPDVPVRPRTISDAAAVQAEWENRYGGTGPAPPAWIDSNGNIVVDATRVNVYEGGSERGQE